MITVIDAINEVIAFLYNSNVRTSISGTIGTERPVNSNKEDITVGTLPITFEQLQTGVVNVNIHVPNLIVTENGIENRRYENRPRLALLSSEVYNVLHNKVTDKIYTTVQNSQLFKEENSSYINYRVEIKAKNL